MKHLPRILAECERVRNIKDGVRKELEPIRLLFFYLRSGMEHGKFSREATRLFSDADVSLSALEEFTKRD